MRLFIPSKKIAKSILLLLLMTTGIDYARAQTIHLFAGNGISTYLGDGGAATAASLSEPQGVAIDGAGNIYIADELNNCIRKINTLGIISTVAGYHGISGFSGDGGAATAATMGGPKGLAVDGAGNLYFSDGGNERIRKVNTSGIISTIAGNGTTGYSGDGIAATAAEMNGGTGVAVDGSGNVYIADVGNHRIRKVNPSGIISTFAGTGSSGYTGDGGEATTATIGGPYFLVFDDAGNLYFSDVSDNVVRKINTSGIITTVAGTGTAGYSGDGGPATAADLNAPMGIALDAAGSIYIGDWSNNRIRKINTSGIISTYAGDGTPTYGGDGGAATAAKLRNPSGVVADGAGNLYIADANNFRIRVVTPASTPVFDGGSPQSLVVCENSVANFINSLLTVTDPGTALTETYSITLAPSHGGISTGSTVTSGTSVVPAGWAYTPTTGYTGTDTFKIQVSNGANTAATTVYVTVNPLPVAGTITGTTGICVAVSATFSDAAPGGVWSSGTTGIATLSSTTGLTTAVTGIAPGTDIIYYTVTNSCGTAVAAYTVNVLGVPVVAAIAGADTICLASPATFTDATTGGTWASSTPSVATIGATGVVTPVATGADTIVYSLTNSCGTTSSIYSLLIEGLPAVGPITGPAMACKDSTVLFTDGTPGGIWSASAHASIGAATGMFTASAVGADTVLYTVTNLCGASRQSYLISVMNCDTSHSNVGVATMQGIVSGLYITPNPSDGHFTLRLASPASEDARITITDMYGKRLQSFDLPTNAEQQVKLSLPAGIYIVSGIIRSETFAARLVIE